MRRKARIDRTAPALVQVAKQLGAQWLPWPNGPVDGLLLHRGRVFIVDWKATSTSVLTSRQQQLLAESWPIHIWSTPEDVISGLAVKGAER